MDQDHCDELWTRIILSYELSNMWKIVFVSIFFLLFSNSKSTQEIQKILRLQLEENGYKTVTMSDGELVVNYLLNAQGGIEDCKSLRRRRMLLGMLKYDVSEKFLHSLPALKLHSQYTHIALTSRSLYIHIALTSRSHYIHIAFTSHSHYIHIALTLHSHCTHIALTLHSHRTHITFTLHSHCTHITLTLNSHWTHITLTCTYIALTLHSQCTSFSFAVWPHWWSRWESNLFRPRHWCTMVCSSMYSIPTQNPSSWQFGIRKYCTGGVPTSLSYLLIG